MRLSQKIRRNLRSKGLGFAVVLHLDFVVRTVYVRICGAGEGGGGGDWDWDDVRGLGKCIHAKSAASGRRQADTATVWS